MYGRRTSNCRSDESEEWSLLVNDVRASLCQEIFALTSNHFSAGVEIREKDCYRTWEEEGRRARRLTVAHIFFSSQASRIFDPKGWREAFPGNLRNTKV